MGNYVIEIAQKDPLNTKLTKNTYPPEVMMWSSVLEISINDFVHGYLHGLKTEEFVTAREWIYSLDQSAFNSFDAICMVFNLDPDAVREALLCDPVNIKQRLSGKKINYGRDG